MNIKGGVDIGGGVKQKICGRMNRMGIHRLWRRTRL